MTTQVRDRSGRVLTVTDAKAEELLKTGQYQYVATSTTAPSSSTGPLVFEVGPGSDFKNRTKVLQRTEGQGGASTDIIPQDAVIYRDQGTGQEWTYGEVLAYDQFLWTSSGGVRGLFENPMPATLSYHTWYNSGASDEAALTLSFASVADEGDDPFGGGGAVAPTFIPQDPDEVREQVRNYIVAITGTADEALITAGVATFQSTNKKAFGKRESQTISPWQAMKEQVRLSTPYKAIHALRPDSVDEMDWVTSRQAKLSQLGISDARAQQLGVNAAIAGASDEALTGQAKMAQVSDTGRLLAGHRNSLKRTASAAMGLI